MREKSAVAQYEKVQAILMYLANTNQPKTNRDIADDVTDISISNVHKLMVQLIEAGYVYTLIEDEGCHKRYYATNRTIELYGTAQRTVDKPKPKYRNTGYGKEKLCSECEEYYPLNEQFFYRCARGKQAGAVIRYEGKCIPCYNARKAQYRLKSKQRKEFNHE